jgi:hypothetical protein
VTTPRIGRRILAVAASVSIGIVGALSLASPASAHHTNISGTTECADPVTGEWVVTWTVTSWATSYGQATKYKITSLQTTPDDTNVAGIPLNTYRDMDQAFVGEQVLPAEADFAQIEVSAKWNNNNTKTNTSPKVHRPEPCEEEQPSPVTVSDEATCDELLVTVDNTAGDKTIAALITTSAGQEEKADVEAGGSWTVSFTPDDGFTYEVAIDGQPFGQGGWTEPEDCDEPDGGGGGDEELPVTGAQSALIAGGALLLLTAGGAMYVMARRRRIRFIA